MTLVVIARHGEHAQVTKWRRAKKKRSGSGSLAEVVLIVSATLWQYQMVLLIISKSKSVVLLWTSKSCLSTHAYSNQFGEHANNCWYFLNCSSSYLAVMNISPSSFYVRSCARNAGNRWAEASDRLLSVLQMNPCRTRFSIDAGIGLKATWESLDNAEKEALQMLKMIRTRRRLLACCLMYSLRRVCLAFHVPFAFICFTGMLFLLRRLLFAKALCKFTRSDKTQIGFPTS